MSLRGGPIAKKLVDGSYDVFDANLTFDKITVSTERLATLALIFGGKGGHHDDLDIFGLWSRADDVKHVKTGDFGHHDVGDNKVRAFADGRSESFFAVASRYDVITFGG